MLEPVENSRAQLIESFFKLIEQGQSLAAILQMYREHPELINCHHPETQLRPIDYACMMGRLPVVEVLIGLGAEFTTTNSKLSDQYPIHFAAKNGRANIVQFLAKQGADPFTKDHQGNGVLYHAQKSEDRYCIATCENPHELLPLLKQVHWNNPEFIQQSLLQLKKPNFLLNCPPALQECQYNDDDILMWACLDDNGELLERFITTDHFDIKYLLLSLAFNRQNTSQFLMPKLINSFQTDYTSRLDPIKIIDSCYMCAIFSGDWANIELITTLIDQAVVSSQKRPDYIHMRLLYSRSLPYSIKPDSLELFTKLLNMPDVSFGMAYVECIHYAIRTRNNLIFKQVLQLTLSLLEKDNSKLSILIKLLRTAVANGNAIIVDIILSLNSALTLNDEKVVEEAISHGQCSMLDKILAANSDLLLQMGAARTIPFAFLSGNLAILDKLLNYYRFQQSVPKITILDDMIAYSCLKQACRSANPAMVLRALILCPHLKAEEINATLLLNHDDTTEDKNNNFAKISENIAIYKDIRQLIRLLKICQKHTAHCITFNSASKNNALEAVEPHDGPHIQTNLILIPTSAPVVTSEQRLIKDAWNVIIGYLHATPHKRSLAQTSRFFKNMITIRNDDISESISRTHPLLLRHPWKNPYFLIAVYKQLQNSEFISHFNPSLQFLLYDPDNISVLCVLDDNVEQFIYYNSLSLLSHQHANYLFLAIAFGRTKMVNYLLKMRDAFEFVEHEDLFNMAWLSGSPEMVDLALHMIAASYQNRYLVLETKSGENNSYISILDRDTLTPIEASNPESKIKDLYHDIALNLIKKCWVSVYHAIASGNPKIIDKLLLFFPQLIINEDHLKHAARMGGLAMFQKLLEINNKSVLSLDEINKGICSGNLTLVKFMRSKNESYYKSICTCSLENLHIGTNQIAHAILSGNIKMLDYILANRISEDPLIDVVNHNTMLFLKNAVKSKNPAMLNRIVTLITINPDNNINDINPTEGLNLAYKTRNPSMVDSFLKIFTNARVTSLHSVIDPETSCAIMVKRLLEISPNLIRTPGLICHTYMGNDMYDYLTQLLIRNINQQREAQAINPRSSPAA